MPYAPATDADVRRMLDTIGVDSIDDLFADIPPSLRFDRELDIPLGIGEGAVQALLDHGAVVGAEGHGRPSPFSISRRRSRPRNNQVFTVPRGTSSTWEMVS